MRRCKACTEGVLDSLDSMWLTIKYWLRHISASLEKASSLSHADQRLFQEMEVPVCPIKRRLPQVIKWTRPTVRWVKLNVDDSSRGNL